MKINLELMTQARQAAGVETVEAELPEGCTLEQALREIVSSQLESLGPLVFRDNGSVHSSVMLVVNGQMVAEMDAAAKPAGTFTQIAMTLLGKAENKRSRKRRLAPLLARLRRKA